MYVCVWTHLSSSVHHRMSSLPFIRTGKCWSFPCLMELERVVMVRTFPNCRGRHIRARTYTQGDWWWSQGCGQVQLEGVCVCVSDLGNSAVFQTVLQLQFVHPRRTKRPETHKRLGMGLMLDQARVNYGHAHTVVQPSTHEVKLS